MQRHISAISAILTSLLLPLLAAAHPMGNFSISHHASLRAMDDGLHLRYRIDFAEIPAVDELRELNAGPSGEISAGDRSAYLAKKVPLLTNGLTVIASGHPLILSNTSGELLLRPGAGGLPTLLITVDYLMPLVDGTDQIIIEYSDANYKSRTGWREIVASASGPWRIVDSDASPSTSARA